MIKKIDLLNPYHQIKTKIRALIALLRALPEQGLWPYTPDPAAPGLQLEAPISDGSIFGEKPRQNHAWLAGNSRHELKSLHQHLAPLGLPLIAIDTGGLDLHLALATGRLTRQTIETTLKTIDGPAVEAAETIEPKRALLPYPIWIALGGETLGGVGGWVIEPGPANAHQAAAFLIGDELSEEMKVRQIPLHRRFQLTLAHAGLFLLVAAVPLLLFGGWRALAAGGFLALILALAIALLWHGLSRRIGKSGTAGEVVRSPAVPAQ